MTRKRFIKLLMSSGATRDEAVYHAGIALRDHVPYADAYPFCLAAFFEMRDWSIELGRPCKFTYRLIKQS